MAAACSLNTFIIFDELVRSPPVVIPDLIPDFIGTNLYPEVFEMTRFRPQFIPGLFGAGMTKNSIFGLFTMPSFLEMSFFVTG